MIPARAWSDDRVVDFRFDATPYFAEASDDEIVELACEDEWACGYAADEVAEYFDRPAPLGNEGVRRLFEHLAHCREMSRGNPNYSAPGFECSVDPEWAMDWLRTHRQGVYDRLRALGVDG